MLVEVAAIAGFVVLGGILLSSRGAVLIAGYNTLPKEEKAKYDEGKLAKFMGGVALGLAFSMVFWVLSDLLNTSWLLAVGLILFCGITLFALIYANTGNRFKTVQE